MLATLVNLEFGWVKQLASKMLASYVCFTKFAKAFPAKILRYTVITFLYAIVPTTALTFYNH